MRVLLQTAARQKDLNLLRVFQALWLEKNVTRASERLFMSQPAVSHALSRLRHEFGDDLFVRSGKGIVATPFASKAAPQILAVLESVNDIYLEQQIFSPRHSKDRITVLGTDLLEFLLFPKLLKILSLEAPQIQLVSRPSDGSFPAHDLESGQIDFAIAGYFQNVPQGFYKLPVGSEGYGTIVRKSHPMIKGKLDLEAYIALSHVLTSPQGDLDGVVDKQLAKMKLKRTVVSGVTTFQALPLLVESSDLCATLPLSLALDAKNRYSVDLFQPPLKIPEIKLQMFWHQRINRSPIHKWIRGIMANILLKKSI